jgi:maleamate amidohydrolase
MTDPTPDLMPDGVGEAEPDDGGDLAAVVIVGLTTSGCVRATALDALQHGFVPVLVVRDAVGDRDQRPHLANLLDPQAKYADVIGEAEAIEEMTRV